MDLALGMKAACLLKKGPALQGRNTLLLFNLWVLMRGSACAGPRNKRPGWGLEWPGASGDLWTCLCPLRNPQTTARDETYSLVREPVKTDVTLFTAVKFQL